MKMQCVHDVISMVQRCISQLLRRFKPVITIVTKKKKYAETDSSFSTCLLMIGFVSLDGSRTHGPKFSLKDFPNRRVTKL